MEAWKGACRGGGERMWDRLSSVKYTDGALLFWCCFLFFFLPFYPSLFPFVVKIFDTQTIGLVFCLWRLLFHFFNKQPPCLLLGLVFWKFGRFSVCVVWSKNMQRQVQLILFIFSFELSWNKRRRQALEDLEAFPVRPLFFLSFAWDTSYLLKWERPSGQVRQKHCGIEEKALYSRFLDLSSTCARAAIGCAWWTLEDMSISYHMR